MSKKTRFRVLGLGLVVLVCLGCDPSVAQRELVQTYNARQCIIDRESRSAGMYTAENPISTASGAYQWLNSTWRTNLVLAEQFYGLRLTSPEEDEAGARGHAAYASPYAQDVVTAYVLAHRPKRQKPWPYNVCWAKIGSEPILREDGPVNQPTQFIQEQMDPYAIIP